ncbi:MAG: DUF4097 family beta strand repeat-containing protein [Bryobacteraceae bacterium]
MKFRIPLAVFALAALAGAQEIAFERSFPVSGPVELNAATHAGSISVRAGTGSEVRVRGAIRPNGDSRRLDAQASGIQQNPPVRQSGNIITIERLPESDLRHRVSIRYEIETPAVTRLAAEAGAGQVSVEGLHGDVKVRTGAGKISIAGVHGAIDAQSGAGSINVEQATSAPVSARTSAGSIMVRLPGSGFDVKAHTSAGRVQIAGASQPAARSPRQDINAKLRGGGPAVDLSTAAGGIRVE